MGWLPARRDGSDLGLAAIDEELGAGHEAGVVRGQKRDCLPPVVRAFRPFGRSLPKRQRRKLKQPPKKARPQPGCLLGSEPENRLFNQPPAIRIRRKG